MPSGRAHDRITVAVALIGAAAMQYDTQEWRVALVYAGLTLFSGLLFSPDLDLHSESYVRWGWLRFIWWPYKTALPHRHVLSHGFLIGIITRIIYLHVMVGLLIIGLLWSWRTFWIGRNLGLLNEAFNVYDAGVGIYRSIEPVYLLAGFIGLWVGAEAHTIADLVWSRLKRNSNVKRGRKKSSSPRSLIKKMNAA